MKRSVLILIALLPFCNLPASGITYPPLTSFLWGNTGVNAPAQTSYVSGSGYPYRLLLPPYYNPAIQYPLIVFLHGGGEVGTNDTSQLTAGNNTANGALALVSTANPDNQANYPCFFAAPQMPVNDHWNGSVDAQAVWNLVQILKAHYSVDTNRIILTGLSSGGMGCFNIPPQLPSNPFCCFVPMSAYSLYPDSAPKVPYWVFHAANDPTVSIVSGQGGAGQLGSDVIVPHLRSLGYSVIYTRYDTGGHGIWSVAYQHPQLLPWMMAQRLGQPMQGVPGLAITNSTASSSLALSGTSWTSSGFDFTRIGWGSGAVVPSAVKTDGTSSGTTSFVSPSSSFDSSYVGQRLSLLGTGTFGAVYYDIVSVVNPTTVTLSAATASGTYSFLCYPYGTFQNPDPASGSLTPNWSLPNIPVHGGTNAIEVIGEMPSGNSSRGGMTTVAQFFTFTVSNAPFASTQAATLNRPAGATLNGLALPEGSDTTAWLQFGTNANYGQQTPATDIGSGYGLLPVGAAISGLAAHTIYHFRLVASNALGMAVGGDRFFTTGGRVKVWGDDSLGQTDSPPDLTNVVAVAAGAYHTLALRNDGTVSAWGYNKFGQCDVPPDVSNVVALAAGFYHSLALKADGTVAAWGDNTYGQLNTPANATNVVAIAAGLGHSLALRNDGTVIAWGYNNRGQATVPDGLANVVAVAAGMFHSVALKADGTVTAWGDDFYGQTDVPADLTNVVAIAAGEYHCLARESDGTIAAWGRNLEGQTNTPMDLTNVASAVSGGDFNLILNRDGGVAAFGDNGSGQQDFPAGLTNVAQLAAGVNFGAAIANQAPQAGTQTVSGFVNHDLLIALHGLSPDGNPLSFRITNLSPSGALYQYTDGVRGDLISAPNTIVSDPGDRIFFAPGTNGVGSPYSSFDFAVNDGANDSAAATVTVNITLPPAPQWGSSFWNNGGSAFELNFSGASNATYSLWTSTNLSNWFRLGTANEISPGAYEFLDATATNSSQRFYRASAP